MIEHSLVKAIIITRVIEMISSKYCLSLNASRKLFYNSNTIKLIEDNNTGLYSQSPLYNFSLFQEEYLKMQHFHKINKIYILENYRLKIEFINSEIKIYDVKKLIDNDVIYKPLLNKTLFLKASVDVDRCGVIWNDDIDISCDKLYENGITYKKRS